MKFEPNNTSNLILYTQELEKYIEKLENSQDEIITSVKLENAKLKFENFSLKREIKYLSKPQKDIQESIDFIVNEWEEIRKEKHIMQLQLDKFKRETK